MNQVRYYDLNMEEILEDWEIYHAIREVISNALDEQYLTNTKDIKIFEDKKGRWHIRDFGRGLRDIHLTQKEDEEKCNNPNTIGKFGIGLKDALGTFYRRRVKVTIRSRHLDATTTIHKKHQFENIEPLHAAVKEPSDPAMEGTEFILENVSEEDINKAKNLFLKFSNEDLIEKTNYGEVYNNRFGVGNIYINGLKVADEEDFLFSYNITSLTKRLEKALNRERTNVGRNAYHDRVEMILKNCESEQIGKLLAEDLKRIEEGTHHDELAWIAIKRHAVKILNSKGDYLFVSSKEIQEHPKMIDDAKSRDIEIVTIPENLKEDIPKMRDISGGCIRDMNLLFKEERESFEFQFVSPDELKKSERHIFDKSDIIFKLIGGRPKKIKEVLISETMRKDPQTFREAEGLWEGDKGRIIVKRDTLKDLSNFAGTLLHEAAHCISDCGDISRDFESELTNIIGRVVSNSLK
ncbi:MAG: hypothetical protein BAJALOKI2v1_70004 [Promethearchaeota archaeon]|nr:MAG: hypothetical protein BAJALOKI2v1_70004 [Candidatus Lokiarchaeota archaeon]